MAGRLERWQADVWLQPLATVLAVAVAAIGIIVTNNSNNDTERRREQNAAELAGANAKNAAKLAAGDALHTFQLSAVQIVMAQRSCTLAQARAKTLILLFPTQLKPVLAPLTRTPPARLCKQLRASTASTASSGANGGGTPFDILNIFGLP